jgi:hypothetical protein
MPVLQLDLAMLSRARASACCSDANGNNYVTLLVNVGPTANLPAWLQSQASGAQGQAQGVMPVANDSGTYSVWQVDGYTVLDMSQFNLFQNVVCSTTGSTTTCNHPLLMQIRNTLPSSTFGCSGAAVPFSTAEYTDAGGLMGPYVPLGRLLDAAGNCHSRRRTAPAFRQCLWRSPKQCQTHH